MRNLSHGFHANNPLESDVRQVSGVSVLVGSVNPSSARSNRMSKLEQAVLVFRLQRIID